MVSLLSKAFFGFLELLLAVSVFHLLGRALEEGHDTLTSLAFFALAGLAYCDVVIIYHRIRKVGQRQRNRNAQCILNAVLSGRIQRFCIFLRPFYTTDRIRTRVTMPAQGGQSYNATYWLEDQFVAALRKTIPMIALGRLHEAGVGRILAGKNWPSVAFNLIDHAALIICIPSMRCGTRRELDYIIRNRLLGKTIFLMPSDDRIIFTFRNLRDDWKNVLEYLAPKGIKFPQYSSSGLLFSIDGSGEYIKEELDLTSRRSIREAVVRLVAVGLDGNKIHAVAT